MKTTLVMSQANKMLCKSDKFRLILVFINVWKENNYIDENHKKKDINNFLLVFTH